jgi:hypothetical protein
MFVVFCGGVCAQDGNLEPKMTCSKIVIFQPILEFQKQKSIKQKRKGSKMCSVIGKLVFSA